MPNASYEISCGASDQPFCFITAPSAQAALATAALLHEMRFGTRPTFQLARRVSNLRRSILAALKPCERCERCGRDTKGMCLFIDRRDGRLYCGGCAP